MAMVRSFPVSGFRSPVYKKPVEPTVHPIYSPPLLKDGAFV
jgi:hypothetical protein